MKKYLCYLSILIVLFLAGGAAPQFTIAQNETIQTPEETKPGESQSVFHSDKTFLGYTEDGRERWSLDIRTQFEPLGDNPQTAISPDPAIAQSTDDAHEVVSTTAVYTNGNPLLLSSSSNPAAQRWGGFRFASGEFPAQGTTFTSCYISLVPTNASYDDINHDIYFQQATAPLTFTTDNTNISSRQSASSSVNWYQGSLGTSRVNSPSLVALADELWTSYGPTAVVVLFKPRADVATILYCASYDGGDPNVVANFHLEWTTGTPPAAPTSVAATDGLHTDKVVVTWTKSDNATGYYVLRDSVDVSGLLGDVATYDDTGAPSANITAGTLSASDNGSTSYVTLSLSGESANNGKTCSYTVIATNASGNSTASTANTGYRGIGVFQAASGQGKVRGLCYFDGYYYAALYMTPAMLLKVDASTMAIEDYYTGESDENYGTSVCTDGTYVYLGTHDIAPATSKVIQINPADMSKVARYVGGTNELYVRWLLYYSPFLYAVYETPSSGYIKKLETAGMTANATWNAPNPMQPVCADTDGTYIYVAGAGSPAKLYKVNMSTMATVTGRTLASGENIAHVLKLISSRIYICFETSPGTVRSYSTSDLSEYPDYWLGTTGQNDVRGMATDNTSIFIGFNINPAIILKIPVSTMTTDKSWTGNAYQYAVFSMVYQNGRICAGFDGTPARMKVLSSGMLIDLGYQAYRSAADSEASFSAISGAITDPYNDTTAPAPTVTPGTILASDGGSTSHVDLNLSGQSANAGDGRFYLYELWAVGATSQNTTANRGNRAVGSLTYQWYRSIDNSDASLFVAITGGTTNPYHDTAAPAPYITVGTPSASQGTSAENVTLILSGASASPGETRWYYCMVLASGATSQATTHNPGYIGVGSLTYQWQRSAVESDADYSNLAGGTTATFVDTSPASTGARFYRVVLDATGAAQQVSIGVRGWIIGAILGGLPLPPVNLTITQIAPSTVTITWTLGLYSTNTTIRMKDNSAPASLADGYEVYSGNSTSTNVTGMSIGMINYNISGWGLNNLGYSTEYSTTSIGGEGMTDIATQLSNLVSALGDITWPVFEVVLVIGLLFLALWRQKILLYMVSGLVTLFIGLSWVSEYAGVAIAMLFLAAYEMLEGLLMALASDKPARGWSQFRGLWNKVKDTF